MTSAILQLPPPSPFPMELQGRTVVDERCRCGALRSQHAHTLAYGHGGCAATGCAKFTWVSMVFAPSEEYDPLYGEVVGLGTAWDLFTVDSKGTVEIQRIDTPWHGGAPWFDSDLEARIFVDLMALAGYAAAIEAKRRVGEPLPADNEEE